MSVIDIGKVLWELNIFTKVLQFAINPKIRIKPSNLIKDRDTDYYNFTDYFIIAL
jgi:hypothetical protein